MTIHMKQGKISLIPPYCQPHAALTAGGIALAESLTALKSSRHVVQFLEGTPDEGSPEFICRGIYFDCDYIFVAWDGSEMSPPSQSCVS